MSNNNNSNNMWEREEEEEDDDELIIQGNPSVESKKNPTSLSTVSVPSSSSSSVKRRRLNISSFDSSGSSHVSIPSFGEEHKDEESDNPPTPLILNLSRNSQTPEEYEQNRKLDPPISASPLSIPGYNMPILYCYDDIKWTSENVYPASRPNLMYSKDCLCVYLPTIDDSSTRSVTSFNNGTKTCLILSFDTAYIGRKWYGLNLTGECNSNQKLITSLLQDASVSQKAQDYSCIWVLDDTVYRIVRIESSLTSELQVLETNISSWKNLRSLEKVRLKPWIISIGDNIYILGAEAKSEDDGLYTINDIEVFEKHKWTRLPLIPIGPLQNWLSCFVVASESLNKIVIGSCDERCLYLYDVSSFQVEKLDLSQYDIYWMPDYPPVVVGNILFWFFDLNIVTYDLLSRHFLEGKIDNLDKPSFFDDKLNMFGFPLLIDLGGGSLCLVCYKSNKPKTTIHCCVFDVPEFTTESGKRLLRGRGVPSIHKFNIEYAASLSNVLLI